MIELECYVAEQNDYPLQIPGLDGQPATTFEESDTLFLSVWEGQSQAAIFSNAPVWLQQVTDFTITNGGTGYTSTPTIAITGGGATTDATAYPILTAGVVTSIVITDGGQGYDGSTVTVAFSGGGGSGAAATAIQTLGWQSGLVAMAISPTESVLLTPGGTYRFQVTATRGLTVSVVIDGLIKALVTPGMTPPSPPDLVTLDYAASYCEVLGLTDAQRDLLPALVAAASMAARRYCQDRNFDLRTYVEFQDVSLNGQIRLLQVPVQQVQRVQGTPQLALTISNTSASVQAAQAYFSYSGTWQGYTTNAQTPTGIVLSKVSSGVVTAVTVDYDDDMTISDLAALINAVGGGWTATTDSTLGLWPVTELDGGFVGQGCATGVFGGQGAQFNILQDLALNGFRLDTGRMGFVLVGRQDYSLANRWGPGGYEMFSSNYQCGRVKVTYVAGESVVPQQVQLAVADMCKYQLQTAKTDPLLESETAQEYSYKLCARMLGSMSDFQRQMLAPYQILRA